MCEHNHRISALEKQNEEIFQRLDKLETRFSRHETKLQECQDSVNFVEAEIPHLRHLVHRNEELENDLAFRHPPD